MVWAAIVSIRMDKAKGVDGREIEVKSQSPTRIAMLAMFINYIDHSDFANSSTMIQPPPVLLCHLCVVPHKRRSWSTKAPDYPLAGGSLRLDVLFHTALFNAE